MACEGGDQLNALDRWEKLVDKGFDDRLAMRRIAATWRTLRCNSADALRAHARQVAEWMSDDGLEGVEVLGFPADGQSAHGGWRMPLCWSPRQARLEILSPQATGRVVADYAREPLHLVMYSRSTPKRGVEAGIVRLPCPPGSRLPRSLKGCIVLFDGAPDMEAVRRVLRAGALGFVTDAVPLYEGIRDAADVQRAVPYCNNLLPPWQVPDKERGFGFAVAPETGQRLRDWLSRGPLRVRAFVQADLAQGELPVVTGGFAGRTGKEMLITAHFDEPGANDNASGVALALGVGRMLAGLRRKGWEPERGIRFFFSVETRGLMDFLNRDPRFFRHCMLGLSLDMLAVDQSAPKVRLKIAANLPAAPDPGLPLLLQCLRRYPALRHRIAPELGDNAMGDPRVGAPGPLIVQAPVPTYHTSLDTPASLSPVMLRQMGRCVGQYVGVLCDAGPDEVRWLARLGSRYARRHLAGLAAEASRRWPGEEAAALKHATDQERRRLTALLRFLPDELWPWVDGVTDYSGELQSDGLTAAESARQYVLRLARRIAAPPVRAASRTLRLSRAESVWQRQAARLVPLKPFRGFLAAESLDRAARRVLCRVAASDFGWGAPWWLQWALAWSNGNRTLAEIGALLRYEGRAVPTERLVRTFRVLAQHGLVRWRPVLRREDWVRALRRVGVRPGMLLVTHSSLSAFGYVEGGAATVIDALRKSIGDGGTLAMPTHSLNRLGCPPYDPRRSRSTVGTITDVFRSMPGVVRSPHPTHSVAACGPLAETLTAGHTSELAPLAWEGFWGRFVDHDGWVLMLAPLSKNTLCHAAELRSGVKLPSLYLPRGRGKVARVLPTAPWHTEWFAELYARLRRRGRIRSVPLGESTMHLMRGRDIIEVGCAVLRGNPLAVAKPNCRCTFCRLLHANHAAAG